MKTPTVLATQCRVYRGTLNSDGYAYPVIYPGSRKHVLLHRWVVSQVLGRPLLRSEVVRHRCDNPPCFRYCHLVLGTQSDNMLDMHAKGRGHTNYARGERSGQAKLTDLEASQIWYLLATPNSPGPSVLGALYGVSPSTIRAIRNHQNWRA